MRPHPFCRHAKPHVANNGTMLGLRWVGAMTTCDLCHPCSSHTMPLKCPSWGLQTPGAALLLAALPARIRLCMHVSFGRRHLVTMLTLPLAWGRLALAGHRPMCCAARRRAALLLMKLVGLSVCQPWEYGTKADNSQRTQHYTVEGRILRDTTGLKHYSCQARGAWCSCGSTCTSRH